MISLKGKFLIYSYCISLIVYFTLVFIKLFKLFLINSQQITFFNFFWMKSQEITFFNFFWMKKLMKEPASSICLKNLVFSWLIYLLNITLWFHIRKFKKHNNFVNIMHNIMIFLTATNFLVFWLPITLIFCHFLSLWQIKFFSLQNDVKNINLKKYLNFKIFDFFKVIFKD